MERKKEKIVFLLFIFFTIWVVNGRRMGDNFIGCGTKCGGVGHEFALATRPGIQNCTLKWYTQTVDHFNFAKPIPGNYKFQQRYYICDLYWNQTSTPKGPIFFYTGNEGDVTLYVNNTGLMWESAPLFGALLIFAEHRYYGESLPFGSTENDLKYMQYLTTEQALADYAELIFYLKKELSAEGSPVISFGGSYGGMLSSWFRMKYPSAVAGAIAASAPIVGFYGMEPEADPYSFPHVVTRDATPIAGASENCANNMRRIWDIISGYAQTESGRQTLQSAFKLCETPESEQNGYEISYWIESAMNYLAMGDYPYPSSYMSSGDGLLPAYPMISACSYLSSTFGSDPQSEFELLSAVEKAVSIFYNASLSLSCYSLPSNLSAPNTNALLNPWNYQWCTELMIPQSTNGVSDMFFNFTFTFKEVEKYCDHEWNVQTRPFWAAIQYGGWNIQSSNIVFSNGLLDPWSAFGVKEDISDSVVAVIIPNGGHHLDLFWSNPLDPADLRLAREIERQHIRSWISPFYSN